MQNCNIKEECVFMFVKKRRSAALFLSLIMLSALLSGCVNNSQPNESDNEVAARTQTAQVITDHMGREVAIPSNPERILALNSAAMEALFSIGITPVGKVEEYKIRQEGVSLPSVGKQQTINIETIHQLKPDLIFAHKRHHGQMVKLLEETGAAVFVFDPDDVGNSPVLDVVTYLGKVLDRQEAAEKYVSFVLKIADDLKLEIQKKTDIKTAVILQDGDTVSAAQNSSSYGAMLTLLGIENIVPKGVTGSSKSSFVSFDIETIIAKNPDIVFIMTSSNDQELNKEVLKKYINDSQWASLEAVKGNRVKILPFKVNPARSSVEDMVKLTAQAILSDNKDK
jgi:iron complex transport system substrate-binding protein